MTTRKARVTVTGAMRQEARRLRASGVAVPAIAETLGIATSTAFAITRPDADEYAAKMRARNNARKAATTTDRGSRNGLERPDDSLRDRLYQAVRERDWPDAHALTEAVRHGDEGFDDHEVVHILYRLRRSGDIEFREQKRGTRTLLLGIRWRGRERPVRVPVTVTASVPTPAPEAPAAAVSLAETRTWPILVELRSRAAGAAEARRHAEALIDAAATLAELDPAESDRLAQRAATIAAPLVMSPCEAEYLAYADHKEEVTP